MRTILAFTYGIILTLIAVTYIVPSQTIYETEVITRTVVDEKVTTLDLEDLRNQIQDLDEQLYTECINVIERETGDPKAGIIIHVERHYQGDACKAAEEAIRGGW